jgi:hypothetical protein
MHPGTKFDDDLVRGNAYAGAVFSGDTRYRYRFWRMWSLQHPSMIWIMLNPSTADEQYLDPTVKKCGSYAKAMGYGGFEVYNLFALRSTDPRQLYGEDDPVGEHNLAYLECIPTYVADMRFMFPNSTDLVDRSVVAAWGVHGAHRGQGRYWSAWLAAQGVAVYSVGRSKDGHPKHPLYVSLTAKMERFTYDS